MFRMDFKELQSALHLHPTAALDPTSQATSDTALSNFIPLRTHFISRVEFVVSEAIQLGDTSDF